MTKLYSYFLLILLCLYSIDADAQTDKLLHWANQGAVVTQNYNSEIPFRYIDGYIFIDVIQHGKTFNFLFDTGAEATVIDKSIIDEFEFKPFSTSDVSGPVIKNQDVSTVLLKNLSIADVEFKNIGAVAINLNFAKKKFCDRVDGILGSTLIKKAKWQIDYKNQVIRLSDKLSNFFKETPEYTLKTELKSKGWGTEAVDVDINGYVSKFDFDTGNGRRKIVSSPAIRRKITKDNKGSVIEYGFKKSNSDYKIIADNISIGEIKLTNQAIYLENEVGNKQLLGNRFLENFLVTMDWENHQVFLEPTNEIGSDTLTGFKLDFEPNFETNRIEILTGLKSFTKKNKIDKGDILVKVNGTDISDLSNQEFCEFWQNTWPQIKNREKINITISHKGNTKELILTKEKLT